MSERIEKSSVQRPSFEKYKSLNEEYESSMECTCSEIATPYSAILSISPVLHSVCSSDFITKDWLWGLTFTAYATHPEDWSIKAVSQFRLLGKFCNLTKYIVDDMVNQLNLRKMITSKLMSEKELNERLNITIDAMIQSTEIHYRVMIVTLETLIQVDQPHIIPDALNSQLSTNTKLAVVMVPNEDYTAMVPSVSCRIDNVKQMLFITCMLRLN